MYNAISYLKVLDSCFFVEMRTALSAEMSGDRKEMEEIQMAIKQIQSLARAGLTTSLILTRAKQILSIAITLLEAQGERQQSGHLVVAELFLSTLPLLSEPIGDISAPDKMFKYFFLAQEKVDRLAAHIDDQTSYDSRRPDHRFSFAEEAGLDIRGFWGGAIRGTNLIFSFSGLPELWDEAFMFVLAIRLGQLDEWVVHDTISEERNPHLRPLLSATATL